MWEQGCWLRNSPMGGLCTLFKIILIWSCVTKDEIALVWGVLTVMKRSLYKAILIWWFETKGGVDSKAELFLLSSGIRYCSHALMAIRGDPEDREGLTSRPRFTDICFTQRAYWFRNCPDQISKGLKPSPIRIGRVRVEWRVKSCQLLWLYGAIANRVKLIEVRW